MIALLGGLVLVTLLLIGVMRLVYLIGKLDGIRWANATNEEAWKLTKRVSAQPGVTHDSIIGTWMRQADQAPAAETTRKACSKCLKDCAECKCVGDRAGKGV